MAAKGLELVPKERSQESSPSETASVGDLCWVALDCGSLADGNVDARFQPLSKAVSKVRTDPYPTLDGSIITIGSSTNTPA